MPLSRWKWGPQLQLTQLEVAVQLYPTTLVSSSTKKRMKRFWQSVTPGKAVNYVPIIFQRLTALGFWPKTLGWSVHDWESLVILQYSAQMSLEDNSSPRRVSVALGDALPNRLLEARLVGKMDKNQVYSQLTSTPYFYHIFFWAKNQNAQKATHS